MKLLDINGKEVSASIKPSEHSCKTKPGTRQYKVLEIAEDVFPYINILEEFTIPSSRLSVDIFIPKKYIVIEVQGEQHQEHNPFFHGSKSNLNFHKQTKRDDQKQNWCDINGFTLIQIFPKESEQEIYGKIESSTSKS